MNEETRNAAQKLLGHHMMKFGVPELFAWAGTLPKKFKGVVGFEEVFVFGTISHATIVKASYIENAKGPVPFQPFHFPEGTGAAVREIDPLLALVAGKDVLVEIGYSEGAGSDLVTIGKWKANGSLKNPIFTFNCRARPVPGSSEGRVFQLSTTEERVDKDFVIGGMAVDEEVIHIRTEITGQLMKRHAGKIEYRGEHAPIILRSSCGSMLSIIKASPPPKVLAEMKEVEIFEDQRLPGLWNEKVQAEIDRAAKEKEDAKAEAGDATPPPRAGRGGKKR